MFQKWVWIIILFPYNHCVFATITFHSPQLAGFTWPFTSGVNLWVSTPHSEASNDPPDIMAGSNIANEISRAARSQYWHESGFTGVLARATLRTCQFASAVITLGIFSADLAHRKGNPNFSSTNNIFAIVVSVLSILTCAYHCFVTVKRVAWVLWDFVLCVLWAACAGTFGSTYIGKSSEQMDEQIDSTTSASMKAGVAFNLLSMCLWLITCVQGSVWCCSARRLTRRTDGAPI